MPEHHFNPGDIVRTTSLTNSYPNPDMRQWHLIGVNLVFLGTTPIGQCECRGPNGAVWSYSPLDLELVQPFSGVPPSSGVSPTRPFCRGDLVRMVRFIPSDSDDQITDQMQEWIDGGTNLNVTSVGSDGFVSCTDGAQTVSLMNGEVQLISPAPEIMTAETTPTSTIRAGDMVRTISLDNSGPSPEMRRWHEAGNILTVHQVSGPTHICSYAGGQQYSYDLNDIVLIERRQYEEFRPGDYVWVDTIQWSNPWPKITELVKLREAIKVKKVIGNIIIPDTDKYIEIDSRDARLAFRQAS